MNLPIALVWGLVIGFVFGLVAAPLLSKREWEKAKRDFNDYCDSKRATELAYYRKLADESIARIRAYSQASLRGLN